MSERMQEIFDNSKNLYDIFISQQDFCEEVASIGAKYNGVFNAGFEDLHIVAVDMINFIFASPLYEGDLYVHDKSNEGKGNVLVAIPSKTEMEKYAENSKCEMIYFTFDDLLYIFEEYNLNNVVLFFNDGIIEFDLDALKRLLYVYQAPTPDTDYVIGSPSEDYTKAIEIITSKLEKYNSIKAMWLYHIVEFPKNKPEKMFDIIIIDMPESDYLFIKDYIQDVIYNTNGHMVKVFMKDSDFGEFLSSHKTEPFYKK